LGSGRTRTSQGRRDIPWFSASCSYVMPPRARRAWRRRPGTTCATPKSRWNSCQPQSENETAMVATKSRLTGGVSIAILRSPGCSVLRWILGVGLHPHESRKTRHTVVFCILFICDASSSRSRTPRWRRAIPAGQRPTSRADVPHLGDLPSSQIMISGNDRRLLDNLRKPGLLALLRDFWNRGTADRRHEGGHGSW